MSNFILKYFTWKFHSCGAPPREILFLYVRRLSLMPAGCLSGQKMDVSSVNLASRNNRGWRSMSAVKMCWSVGATGDPCGIPAVMVIVMNLLLPIRTCVYVAENECHPYCLVLHLNPNFSTLHLFKYYSCLSSTITTSR